MQGFRKKFSKDMYQKIRKVLVQKKDLLFPVDEKNPKQRAEKIVNTLFTLASNKPNNFGVYKLYAADEINEMLAIYEEDLKEICQYLDADHLTRLAQSLYLLKTTEFENVFWRIETQANNIVD